MTTVKALLISLLIVLAGTGGLYATSNNDIERLVSNTDGTYSVYIIAEEEVAHDYFDEVFELRNVSSVRGQTNLEGVIFEDITDRINKLDHNDTIKLLDEIDKLLIQYENKGV